MIQRAFKLVAFLLFTVVTTIALAEMASRVLVPEWAPVGGDRGFWAYDAELGWSHTPGASGQLEYVDFSVQVRINSDGLRDREYPVERVPGKHRMLVLGDSFAWGYGVEQQEVFSELIEKSRPDWEIINSGVSGYGTDQEYLYYKLRGSKYHPDVVLVLFVNNDPDNSTSAAQYAHNKPLFVADGEGIRLTNVPVPGMTATQRVANLVARNTYFLRTASRVAAGWRNRGRVSDAASVVSGLDARSDKRGLSIEDELVLRIFLALNEAVRADGGKLVVVSLPGAYRFFEDPRFTEAGISHLSLSGIFRGSPEPVWFAHDLHWTPAGHRIVSLVLEQYLNAIGVFEDKGQKTAGAQTGQKSPIASGSAQHSESRATERAR